MGSKSSSAVRYPWFDPPIIDKSTSYPPCPGTGLVALRQTFVRRCHGSLGSPGLPGIDKSSMMAGKAARPWDVATSVQTDPPLFMRLSFQRLREALAGSMPASFHHAASLPRADCSSRPLWLPVRNKYLAPINKSRGGTNSPAANGKTRYGSVLPVFPFGGADCEKDQDANGRSNDHCYAGRRMLRLGSYARTKSRCAIKGNISSPFGC